MTATIEEVKKFWNNRPCNIRHSSKEVGTKEYFLEVERKKFKAEPHILEFTEFTKWDGKKVLEIGCGLATAGINFALSGSDYTGVELSEESLSLAKNGLKYLVRLEHSILAMQSNFHLLFLLKLMI